MRTITTMLAGCMIFAATASEAQSQSRYYARSVVAPKGAAATEAAQQTQRCGTLVNPAWIENAATTRLFTAIGRGIDNLPVAQQTCEAYAADAKVAGVCGWDISNGNMFWFTGGTYTSPDPNRRFAYAAQCR